MIDISELLQRVNSRIKASDIPEEVTQLMVAASEVSENNHQVDLMIHMSAFEAGRLAVLEQMINAKPVHQDRLNVFQISEGCVTLVSQGVHNTMNVESFQGCKDARQTIEWLDNREEQGQ